MAQECTLAFMKASGLPPGPRTRQLGQMAEWLVRPNTYAARQRARFGEVFTARIDPIPWVMLGDPADVRTVFTAGPQRTNAGEANEILRPTLGPHSLLLLARDEQGDPMTDAELRDELMTLLTAGHETTATSLAWAVERLVRQPGGLERLAGDPAYVDAVVKETLRLRPVIALVLRKLLEPLEVGGHELPEGTTVAPV